MRAPRDLDHAGLIRDMRASHRLCMSEVGQRPVVGSIFIFGFSGFILLDRSKPFRIESLKRDGFTIEIEPPLRVAPPTWRPIPQLDDASLRRIIPNAPIGLPMLRVAVLPDIGSGGEASLKAIWSDEQAEYANLPADTIAVVVYGPDVSNGGDKVAEKVVAQIFEWLRSSTRQWWIGRPTEAITGNLHTVLPLDGPRQCSGFPEGRARQTSPSEGALRVDASTWSSAIAKVRENKTPTSRQLLLADAVYYYFIRDYRATMIMLCGGYELARDDVLERNSVAKTRLKSSATDLIKHVSLDFGDIFSRSLKVEEPELFAFLKSLWIARGHLAHGKPMMWVEDGKQVEFSALAREHFVAKSERVFDWFDSI